jgi:hypothetical protein
VLSWQTKEVLLHWMHCVEMSVWASGQFKELSAEKLGRASSFGEGRCV